MEQSGQYKALKKADTVYWCEQIRVHSGLSDREIEERLFPVKDYEISNLRNFNRWANGQRAMTHDALQSMVKNARKCGLLPQRQIGPGVTSSYEDRLNLKPGAGRASEKLKERAKASTALHKARKEAIKALNEYSDAMKKADFILAFDASKLENGEPTEVFYQDVDKLAKTVNSHGFFALG